MNRQVGIVICFCILLDVSLAQTPSFLSNDWGFIGGQTGRTTVGNYGQRNKTSLSSVPGSRIYGSAWIDENENYWLYGGYGYPDNSTLGNLGDMWMYDMKKSPPVWTWKSGTKLISDVPALPAALTTSTNIYPPGRERACFWHDKANHAVYLFGGQIATDGHYTNDFWKFDYHTLEWTFIGGTYSTQVETSTWPSSRFGGATWVTGNTLWLFGGWAVNPDTSSSARNDLWAYSLTTNTWSNVNAANSPQARYVAESFVDPRDGYMYLSGGFIDGTTFCRDVQRFNQTLNAWENLNVGSCGYAPPNYGVRGQFNSTNIPGARAGSMFYYAGYLWLFGGLGGRGTPNYYITPLEDVWAFDFNIKQWVWVSGNDTYAMAVETVYTAMGEFTFDPSLGGREGMAVAVSDRNIFAFGGGRQHPLVTYMYGDLWQGRIYRDECSLGVDGCSALAVCTDQDSGYLCQCIPGYIGTAHGVDGCQDTNECTNGTNDCNANALCTNIAGNYTCACNTGFTGSGYGVDGCEDIDECALNTYSCVGVATCNNTVGSYLCVCPQGYISDGQNGCTLIDTNNPLAPNEAPQQPSAQIIDPNAPGAEAGSNVIGIAVGVSIGGAAAVAAVVLAVFFVRRKKKRGVKIEEAMKSLDSEDDRFNIPYSELVFKRELGAGSFGKVFLGTWRKAEVALKLATLSTWEDFAKEVKLTITMPPHPNVVQVFGISRNGPHPVLILEYCDGGSLDRILYDSSTAFSAEQTLEIVYGMAKGMYHLHKNNIVHRDLAARNILLSAGRPKISDFGLARVVDGPSQSGQTKSNIGPLRWMAPESLRTSTYSPQSDVWSFGIVVYEIVARAEPHIDEDPMSVGFRIRDEGLTPTIPADCDPFLRDLMLSCWQSDPSLRPTFDQICESIKSKQTSN